MGGVSCWGPPGLDLPGDDPQVWQSQGRATHTSHLIALPNTVESGVWPVLWIRRSKDSER